MKFLEEYLISNHRMFEIISPGEGSKQGWVWEIVVSCPGLSCPHSWLLHCHCHCVRRNGTGWPQSQAHSHCFSVKRTSQVIVWGRLTNTASDCPRLSKNYPRLPQSFQKLTKTAPVFPQTAPKYPTLSPDCPRKPQTVPRSPTILNDKNRPGQGQIMLPLINLVSYCPRN